jgi:membrane protein DedA with SNARE-associated domain
MFEFIVNTIADAGYVGIFLLMLLENIIPPIPSELIMPLSGFVAARGKLDIVLVVIVGTAGSVIGALPWYFLGARLGEQRIYHLIDRYGRWLTLSRKNIDVASKWYKRHGWNATVAGRLIPALRTLISVPAGIIRMPILPFIACSTIGSLVWVALLSAVGYVLESQYEAVAQYMDAVSKAIIGLILCTYLYRIIRGKGKQQGTASKEH